MNLNIKYLLVLGAAVVILSNADSEEKNGAKIGRRVRHITNKPALVHSEEKNGPGLTREAPVSEKEIKDELRSLDIGQEARRIKSRKLIAGVESQVKKMQNTDKVSRSSTNCISSTLTPKCLDGTCIKTWWIGDGEKDCTGYSEDSEPLKSYMCTAAGAYLCADGCKPLFLLCDGKNDCKSGEDENVTICKAQKPKCSEIFGNFLCHRSTSKERWCIPNIWKCDNEKDCPGGEDELNCGGAVSGSSASGSTGSSVGLSNAASTCYNNICILNSAYGASMEYNCLFSHNKARSFHNSGDLVWNTALETSARNYAKTLTQLGKLQHSTGNYGENLYWSGNSQNIVRSCADAVYSWYREVEYPLYNNNYRRLYNYNSESNSGTGHFTQVVWKGSTSIGCGVAKKQGTKVFNGQSYPWFEYYVVCQYSPPGNYARQYKANVPVPVAVYNVNSADGLKPQITG